jgi:hypothetical protein
MQVRFSTTENFIRLSDSPTQHLLSLSLAHQSGEHHASFPLTALVHFGRRCFCHQKNTMLAHDVFEVIKEW